MIIVGATGADAGAGNRGRSKNKALVDGEALGGEDGGARQGKTLVDGGGGTEIAAGTRGVSHDVVEALTGLGLDKIEVKEGGGGGGAMRVVLLLLVLLVLGLAGLFTPPSGHVLNYWTKHKGTRRRRRRS